MFFAAGVVVRRMAHKIGLRRAYVGAVHQHRPGDKTRHRAHSLLLVTMLSLQQGIYFHLRGRSYSASRDFRYHVFLKWQASIRLKIAEALLFTCRGPSLGRANVSWQSTSKHPGLACRLKSNAGRRPFREGLHHGVLIFQNN